MKDILSRRFSDLAEQIEPDESDVPGEDLDPPEPIVVARQSRSELCDLLGTGFAGSVGLGR